MKKKGDKGSEKVKTRKLVGKRIKGGERKKEEKEGI